MVRARAADASGVSHSESPCRSTESARRYRGLGAWSGVDASEVRPTMTQADKEQEAGSAGRGETGESRTGAGLRREGKEAGIKHRDDRIWLETDFLDLLSTHRAKLLAKTKRTAALSAASGIVAVLRAWNFGSAPGEILSLGVLSTGQFGIPAGLVFSLPVSFQHGAWVVPHDIFIDDHLKIKLQAAAFQLQAEKDSIKIQ